MAFEAITGATLITTFLENVACPQLCSEDGGGGNALCESYNSPGMRGMRYLNYHLTCRLQSSLISINTEARNVNVCFPEREVGWVGGCPKKLKWELEIISCPECEDWPFLFPGNPTPTSLAP